MGTALRLPQLQLLSISLTLSSLLVLQPLLLLLLLYYPLFFFWVFLSMFLLHTCDFRNQENCDNNKDCSCLFALGIDQCSYCMAKKKKRKRKNKSDVFIFHGLGEDGH